MNRGRNNNKLMVSRVLSRHPLRRQGRRHNERERERQAHSEDARGREQHMYMWPGEGTGGTVPAATQHTYGGGKVHNRPRVSR